MTRIAPICQIALVAFGLTAQLSHAHDAWIEAGEGGFQVVFGHEGKLEPATATKIKSLAAVDAVGATLPLKFDAGDSPRFTVSGQPTLLTLHYDNGFWSKTTEGSKNLPKNAVPGALSASHAVKFSKSLLAWNAAITKAQGQQLEIVPAAGEVPRAGGSIQVQVLWNGKPLAGAKLKSSEYAGTDKDVVAGTDGKAAVPVVKGRNTIQVAHKLELPGDPRADVLNTSANLIFDLR